MTNSTSPIIPDFEATLEALGIDPAYAAMGFRAPNAFCVAARAGEIGLRTFPASVEKRPLPDGWQAKATTRLDKLVRWQKSYGGIPFPDFPNFAVRTGRDCGLWVLDVDGAAGRARFADLIKRYGPPPPTPTVNSGRSDGGMHLWFAPHPEGPDLKSVAHAMIDGERHPIDQKGRGGYAILPGSLHGESGRRYQFAPGLSPSEVALAHVPEGWLAILDYADTLPERAATSRRPGGTRMKLEHDPSSRLIGDGPGFGGFQDPIYKTAISFFFQAGTDAPDQPIITLLRELIDEAPKGPGRDVSRYMAGPDLPRAVERARDFVKREGK